jgi:hypothetical protein
LTRTNGSKALYNILQGIARVFLLIVIGKSTYGNSTNHRSYLLSIIYLLCKMHSVANQTLYLGSKYKYLLIPWCIFTGG